MKRRRRLCKAGESFDESKLVTTVRSLLDGANEEGDEVGGGLASSEEARGSPVSLDGRDVGGDGLLVHEVVLGGGSDESPGSPTGAPGT